MSTAAWIVFAVALFYCALGFHSDASRDQYSWAIWVVLIAFFVAAATSNKKEK